MLLCLCSLQMGAALPLNTSLRFSFSNGNFHRWPFQPGKQADTLPNLKSRRSSRSENSRLTPSSPLALAAPLRCAAEESVVGSRAAVFILLLFISLCRHGSKFRELTPSDLASKANPSSKSSQNISGLTSCEQKRFVRRNSEECQARGLNFGSCQAPVTPELEAVVQPAGRGGPTSPYFVNTARGGRYFSIHKNAELAGFCTYALSRGCLEDGVPRLSACAL